MHITREGMPMRYRRDRHPGGMWFFTLNLQDRRSDLLVRHVAILRAAARKVIRDHPFTIEAMVVLPDHLHALWRLPDGDNDYAMRWRLIKSGFSRRLEPGHSAGYRRGTKRERTVWQRRYWEHRIRNDHDYARHIDYIHLNPVKHGYTDQPSDWPWSSIHRFIRNGSIAADWGANADIPVGNFGE